MKRSGISKALKDKEEFELLDIGPTPPRPMKKPKRFGFTIGKDISLLKAAIQHNPFQLGPKKWMDVAEEMQSNYQEVVTERTVKDRVYHLKKLFQKEELTFRTGTEGERTERGKLLEEVIALIEESEATINLEFGANEEMDFATEATDSVEKKRVRQERTDADKDRENIASDLAPEPSITRKKKRMMPEDELIKMKMQHDMKIEEERVRMEQDKIQKEHALNDKKLDFEMKKFELEKEREQRLAEEGKRRDDLARQQLAFQEQIINLFSKFNEK